jgi:hypothetical protein
VKAEGAAVQPLSVEETTRLFLNLRVDRVRLESGAEASDSLLPALDGFLARLQQRLQCSGVVLQLDPVPPAIPPTPADHPVSVPTGAAYPTGPNPGAESGPTP